MRGGELDFLLIAALKSQEGHAADGRIFELFAKFDLLIIKAAIVVSAGILDSGMKRSEGLHDDLAFNVATPRASGHLGEQLKGAFAGAEIGDMEAQIGIDNSHESDVR